MSDVSAETNTFTGIEILVVDDRPADLRLLSEILERAGFRVRPASDGELALRSVKAKLPELILLDIRLPDIGGIEVCRRLKADPATASIPVLFISAEDDDREMATAFQAGGVDYITKPLRETDVLARVKAHIAIAQARTSLRLERDRAQQYLDVVGVMVLAIDTDGKVTLVNREGCRVLGLSEDQILGRSWIEQFIRVQIVPSHTATSTSGSAAGSSVCRRGLDPSC